MKKIFFLSVISSLFLLYCPAMIQNENKPEIHIPLALLIDEKGEEPGEPEGAIQADTHYLLNNLLLFLNLKIVPIIISDYVLFNFINKYSQDLVVFCQNVFMKIETNYGQRQERYRLLKLPDVLNEIQLKRTYSL